MPLQDFDVYLIAGADRNGAFPPGLNLDTPATDLPPWESPDCYGLDLAVDGKVGKGTITIPSAAATARVSKTVTLTEGALSVPYKWHYQRLWNITNRTAATASALLKVGAPLYDNMYYQQGPDMIFNEDANTILVLIPFEPESMAVLKASGAHILSNCSDTRGTAYFGRTPLIQELYVAAANRAVELDGLLFVSNADGLIGYKGGKSVEFTRKVRQNLGTTFVNQALTCDYEKHRVIGGSAFVYEADTEKLFKFSGSTFRFTTRAFHAPDYRPMSPDRLFFTIEHGTAVDGKLKYQVKYDDASWQDVETVPLPYEQGTFTVVDEGLRDARSCRRFQVRITDLSTSKYVKEIRADTAWFGVDDYGP